MAKKRKRAPEVLWRLFGERARTLGDTVLAAAEVCQCKRRRCIGCAGDGAMSLLLRPDDPSDYSRLLTKCFAVVPENAPPLQHFDRHNRWPQSEIVRRSIELILTEKRSSSNLLCGSYDRVKRSSAIVDMLTSSAWCFLLRRVGDALMVYLLKHTSLFLPLPRNKLQQITGFPISDLCYNLKKRKCDYKTEDQLPAYPGLKTKRKRVKGVESVSSKKQRACSLDSDHSSTSVNYVGLDGSSCVSNEQISLKTSEGNSKPSTVSSRKHRRQSRWQRQRKSRQLAIQETSSLIPCTGNYSNISNLCTELQDGYTLGSGQSITTNADFFCCFGSQNVRKISENAEIDRRKMFYQWDSSTSMLPRKRILTSIYILHLLKPNDSGAFSLFRSIFGTINVDKNPHSLPNYHSRSTGLIRSTCLYQSLVELLKSLIRKTQSCRYLRLLDKHCPVKLKHGDPEFEGNNSGTNLSKRGHTDAQTKGKSLHVADAKNGKTISEAICDQVGPSKSYCPKKEVVSFVWAICRRIVPSPLLGTTSNWRILRKNISKFIELRKFEKFTLKECKHTLKLSKFPLLSSSHCSDLHNGCIELSTRDIVPQALLKCWTFWLFSCLVLPLVQANFYVTESEYTKHEVLYYRKSTWEELMGEAKECLKNQQYWQLKHASTIKILQNRSFGFSRVRLLPKHIGFRVLANLQAPSRMCLNLSCSRKFHCNKQAQRKTLGNCREPKRKTLGNCRDEKINFKSVNRVLRDLHVVLKGLQMKEPEKLGSSVFDYNDVYRKLVPFLFLLKNGSSTIPRVFVIVSDVSKAFDTINQKKLISVMEEVIMDDEYTIKKFIQVTRTKKSLKVHQHPKLAHQDSIADSANVRSVLSANPLHGILVRKELSRTIGREDIDKILQEHITRNVVHFYKNFYLQHVGIPQGSVLSSLLCSYYYGHMERNLVVPFLDKACEDILVENDTQESSASGSNHADKMLVHAPKYLLLRFIDDFLFISTSKKQASMFFTRLERGVREYNCCMNKEKYGLNFKMNNDNKCPSNRLYFGKDGGSFLHWSGLLVNCCTLEIQADYTRYLDSHLSSTLTVSRRGKVGCQLKEKLCSYLRPKCHPIFYDSNINSAGVVRLNIYQAFLICAMKFICYISNLSTVPRFSPRFYIDAIVASLRYMNRLIKRRMYTIEAGFRPKYDVKKKEIMWLGLHAYFRVLKKKQSRHKELLRLLVSKLKAYGKVENMSAELKYAIDDECSSILWGIKY